MFFGSSKRRGHQPAARGSGGSEEAPHAAQRQTEHLEDWRRSAQKVTRAWNAWLAAEARGRNIRYRAYLAALADEELAAARIEHMLQDCSRPR